ncbi:MAG: hypothetical protein IJK26_07905, partial [Clostridia bacterium]|nr:hypothetical protein [Clostridia bacterium]
MKKILTVALALTMGVTMLTGCGKKQSQPVDENGQPVAEEQIDRKTLELRQNDYRGGLTRMQAVQNGVLNVMETMKSNNV